MAAGLLAVVLTGVAPLVTMAASGSAAARVNLLADRLALQRLAHLQTLTHIRVPGAVAIDTQTSIGSDFLVGGPGLSISGLGPLQTTTAGWADWLDEQGGWLSSATTAPPGARYRRRWAILAGGSTDCVRLWVEVAPVPALVGGRAAHAGAVQCAWGAWP